MAKEIIGLVDHDVWLAEYRDAHRAGGAGSGRFSRTPSGPLDATASADFVVIDYTLGPWPLPPSEQDTRVDLLRSFQSSASGLFEVKGPGPDEGGTGPSAGPCAGDAVEVAAYFMSVLELLGARPLHPLRALDEARTPVGMEDLLENLHWSGPRGSASGAATALCLAIAGDVGPEWFSRYFAWLDREADPKTGYWRRGVKVTASGTVFGAHGHLVLHHRFHQPIARPGKIIKTVVALQRADGLFDAGGPGWVEVAAAYALDLASRQSGAGRKAVHAALESLARSCAERLADEGFRDSLAGATHAAAGLVALIAVLARALPGSVRSRRPLRFYADRHLFV